LHYSTALLVIDAEALKQRLDALVTTTEAAEEKAATACRCVLAAHQLLDEEQAAIAKKLVSGFTSSSTTELATNSSLYDNTVVTNLHILAAAVSNVRSLVNIVLDAMSDNYVWWRDNMLLALTRYAFTDHVESDDAFPDNTGWTKMDAIVLSWLNTISPDLMEVVRERGHTARHLWLGLQNQFLGNRETHTLHIDAALHNFV
jgi:hypothetical protein